MSIKNKKITIAIVSAIVVLGSFSIISSYYKKAQQTESKRVELSVEESEVSDQVVQKKEEQEYTATNETTEENLQNQEDSKVSEQEETENSDELTTEEEITEEEITEEEETKELEEPAPKFYMEGVRHSTVKDIQQRLMDLGFMEDSEPTDLYGMITVEAVKSFQRQSDIKTDGILGPETYELLLSDNAKHYTLKLGFEGEDVKRLQKRLYEMGYLAESDMITGYFGDVTEAAVKKMQLNNGLYDDGKVGELTFDLLYSEDIKPNLLSYGEQSDVVLAAQKRLKDLGYLTTTPDGHYGNDTVLAVKQFQSRNDLVVDGFLGPSTREVLNSRNAAANGIVLGDSGEAVTRVQELLSKYGYLSSANTTGYFGEITENAVKQFQRNNGLTADGKVGMRTMAKLTGDHVVKANSSTIGNSGNSNSNGGSSSNQRPSSNGGSSSSSRPSNNGGSSSSSGSSSNSGTVSGSATALVNIAKSKIGARYSYGAKGPDAFDCSGFIYWCLNQAGVKQSYLTSSGWQNVGKYKRISSLSDVRAGDIIVVRGHVGIAAGNGMVIDASTSEGKIVYRGITSWWKNRFIVAWRIFD